MIKFEDVVKQYPLGNKALDEVSFEVEDGEFVFLVGPSGAGKTTVIKMILRQVTPTSGRVKIDDFNVSDVHFKAVEKLRRKIGVVFQDFKILLDKNIFENIAVSLKILDVSSKKIKDEVNEALELVGLKGKEYMFPAQLSAGELQRVAIARAVVGDRKFILADEPTGNLDPRTSWEIMKIFKKLENAKTIVFATHNADIVNSLKKRVIVLKDGKLVKDTKKGGYEL